MSVSSKVYPTESSRVAKEQEERLRSQQPAFPPACVYEETSTSYVVSFYAPGLSPEDLDIEVSEEVLILRGESREPKGEKVFHCYCHEFQKSFVLGEPIDEDGIEVRHNDGLFALFLPKA